MFNNEPNCSEDLMDLEKEIQNTEDHDGVVRDMNQREYTYSEHARLTLKVHKRKRKKKKRGPNSILNRPDWTPNWHVNDEEGNTRAKKVGKVSEVKRTARGRAKDTVQNNDVVHHVTEKDTQDDTENCAQNYTQNEPQIIEETIKNEGNYNGTSNPSIGTETKEDESINFDVELPPLEPRWISARDRYTETGTIKTTRSSVQTLPDIRPHGQGVYVVAPFYVNHESQPDQIRFGYSARPTACGLTDPWIDLTMDHNMLPKIDDRALVSNSPELSSPRPVKKLHKRKDAEGSTMCPQFPVVSMPTTEYDKKTIYYSDVDKLRDQLDKRKVLIHKQQKDESDYKKTKQDFYRMELDSIRRMEPDKQTRMREMYFSYLQNSPGSKKALKECIKKMG